MLLIFPIHSTWGHNHLFKIWRITWLTFVRRLNFCVSLSPFLAVSLSHTLRFFSMFPPPVFSLSPRLCLSTPPSLFGSFPLSLSLSPSLALARFFVSPLWSESRFLWYRCIWVFVCFTGEYYRRGRVHLLQAYLTIFKFYFLTCTSASFGLNASYGLNALCQPLKGFQVSYTTIAPCCTCCNLGPECAVKTASITAMAAATPLTLWLSLLLKARDLRSQDVTTWILYEYCMNIVWILYVIGTHVRRHCCHNHGNAPRGHNGCQAMALLTAAIAVLLVSVLRANLTSTRQPWQWACLCSTANPVCLIMAVNTTGMPPRPRSLMMMIV